MSTKTDTPKRHAAIKVQPRNTAGADAPITEAAALTLTSATGATLVADPMLIPAHLTSTLVLHGLKQKLVDAAAISRDPETGREASPAIKWAAVVATWERLQAGEWFANRGEGGGGAGGLLFRALCRMYPKQTAEQIREFLAGKTDKEQAALRGNPKVAAIIAQIKAEDAKADDIDTDSLLAGLDGGDEAPM